MFYKMSLLELIKYGANDVYLQGTFHDYQLFMKSTNNDKDNVKEERNKLHNAYTELMGAYMANELVQNSNFYEKNKNFNNVLNEVVTSCHKKGINAETTLTQFFKIPYHRH